MGRTNNHNDIGIAHSMAHNTVSGCRDLAGVDISGMGKNKDERLIDIPARISPGQEPVNGAGKDLRV
jgi:hypothetical protein